MDIKEAEEIIKKYDPALLEWLKKNGMALSNLQLINYAGSLIQKK